MNEEFRIGYPRYPGRHYDEEGTVLSPAQMRASIERASINDPLADFALTLARRAGMSGEDTMTLVAFNALRRLEAVTAMLIDAQRLRPSPPVVVNKKENVDGGL